MWDFSSALSSELLLILDYTNTLQVGCAVGDMCSKHLLFIILQGIHAFPPVFFRNLIKSFKTTYEQHVLILDQTAVNTKLKNIIFLWVTLTKRGLHETLAMGRLPLMENLALMILLPHWLSLDSLAFKWLPNELFPFTRMSQPVMHFSDLVLLSQGNKCCQLTELCAESLHHAKAPFCPRWPFLCL